MSGLPQPPQFRPPNIPSSHDAMTSSYDGKCSRTESTSDLVASLRQLRDCKYYWGPLCKKSATEKLANQPDGVFLLRDSSDEHHFFALSFRMNSRTHHVRISYSGGMFCFDNVLRGTIKRPSIMDLIYTTMVQSRNSELQYFLLPKNPYEAPLPVSISFPISRDSLVHSLKHLSRQAIRRCVRLDHINDLPLPQTLLEYLQQGQYYCEHGDDSYPVCDVSVKPPMGPPLPPPRSALHRPHSQPG